LSTLQELLSRWPLVRQLRDKSSGTASDAMTERTNALLPRNDGASISRSVCPYCGVGCGQLVFHHGGRIVSIEGDPGSPISRGRLCPKGAASQELLTHPDRATKALHRRPHSRNWEPIDLEDAMDRIAERVWHSRERTFQETRDGQTLMATTAIGHIGGATLDNEENYLIKKLFTAGLGMVCVTNQARI
jgi:formate dehydrogenase major subunit